MEGREEKLDELYEEIEKDLLVGPPAGEGTEGLFYYNIYIFFPVFSCWA